VRPFKTARTALRDNNMGGVMRKCESRMLVGGQWSTACDEEVPLSVNGLFYRSDRLSVAGGNSLYPDKGY